MLSYESEAELGRAYSLAFVTVPAFYSALCFAAGIGAAQVLYRVPAFVCVAAIAGFAAVLFCRRASRWQTLAALLLAWFAAGMFCAEVETRPAPAPALQAALLADGDVHTITGVVAPATRSPLYESESDHQPLVTLDLALQSIDGNPIRPTRPPQIARLHILHAGTESSAPCGAEITFAGKLHSPPRYYTPGAWDEAAWLAQQGVFAEGSVHANALQVLAPSRRSVGCMLAAARNHALERLDMLIARTSRWPRRWQFAALNPQDASLLAAALLGDRTRLDPSERTEFQRVGAFHLLVVSGLGIAILCGYLWWLLRKLRCTRAWATVLTLAVLTLYAELTGMGVPVKRALLMLAVYMFSRLLYRRVSPLNTLSVAALVLLVAAPSALLTASLQMTLLAVAAIAGFASPMLERTLNPWVCATQQLTTPLDAALPPRLAQFRITLRMWSRALRPLFGLRLAAWLPAAIARGVLYLGELACISFVLQLAMAVAMAVEFHRIVAFGLGANLLTVPLLALLLPVALLTVALACVSLTAAAVPAMLTACLLHLASGAVHVLAVLPAADWRTPPTRPLAIALALVCLLLAIVCAHQRRRVFAFSALALLIATGALALWPVPLRVHANDLEITALDVGQGDSILVVAPQGKSVLVDAGGPAGPFASTGAGDFYGEDIVSPYLWSRGIRRLDAVALTHAHEDHMGGMPAVLRNFHPKELWVASNPPVAAYVQLLDLAKSLGIHIRTLHEGDAFDFGGATVQVLSPQRGYQPGAIASNEDSLVMHVAFQQTSVLLEGDAQRASEQAMLASPRDAPLLRSDLLKVGHHGSLSSTTPDFLNAVHPQWAVISAGRHNLFGHPRYPILLRLGAEGARVYRTDLDGASSFLLTGKTVITAAP
jgi:competence protein ComEC